MLLEIAHLTKSYDGPDGPIEVLRGISFSLNAGETLALTGESGSGKSTILHLIGGLDTADSGSIKLMNQEMSVLDDAGRAKLRRDQIGIIFQQYNLIPSLTVAANIAFHARLAGRTDAIQIASLAEALGLTSQLDKYPEQLSGGQQQRVAIARTLAAKPALVLADEPTGNLDEATGDEVVNQMLKLVGESATALMMVTHSSNFAVKMDRQLHLRHGVLE